MSKRGFKVMDCDIHVREPEDLWTRYIEPAFRDRAPIREKSEGTDALGPLQYDSVVLHILGQYSVASPLPYGEALKSRIEVRDDFLPIEEESFFTECIACDLRDELLLRFCIEALKKRLAVYLLR